MTDEKTCRLLLPSPPRSLEYWLVELLARRTTGSQKYWLAGSTGSQIYWLIEVLARWKYWLAGSTGETGHWRAKQIAQAGRPGRQVPARTSAIGTRGSVLTAVEIAIEDVQQHFLSPTLIRCRLTFLEHDCLKFCQRRFASLNFFPELPVPT